MHRQSPVLQLWLVIKPVRSKNSETLVWICFNTIFAKHFLRTEVRAIGHGSLICFWAQVCSKTAFSVQGLPVFNEHWNSLWRRDASESAHDSKTFQQMISMPWDLPVLTCKNWCTRTVNQQCTAILSDMWYTINKCNYCLTQMWLKSVWAKNFTWHFLFL